MSSKQKLLDAINQANGTNLTLADLQLDNPVVIDSTAQNPQNTQVVLRAVREGQYRGNLPIEYYRNDALSVLAGITLVASVPKVGVTVGAILESLQKRYGLTFQSDDLTFGPFDDSSVEVSVATSTTGYAWLPDQTFKIKLVHQLIDISNKIAVVTLNGFSYPALPSK